MTPNYEGECATLANEMNDLTSGFDPYALDFPVCDIPSKKVGRYERATLIKAITRAAAYASAKEEMSPTLRGANTIESVSMRQLTSDYFPTDYEACSQDYATTYLNRRDVQDALGVVGASLTGKSGWNDCSNYVGENYNQDDVNAPMMEFWEFLTAGGYDLNMMIYSGDDDSVCATAGTQQFIWNMKWNVISKWQPWTFTATEGSQIGGFHVAFENPRDTTGKGGVLHFCTVHGAGHMTPATRPLETFTLLQNFMKKKEIFA
jgi:carboxypeptidase C (cathepsin A)